MEKTPALPAHEVRPEFEYVYHWHRIIPAVASLAIGAGAVLWFWPSATPGESAQASSTVATTQPAPLRAKTVVVDLPLQIHKPGETVSDAATSQPVASAQTAASTQSVAATPGTVREVSGKMAPAIADNAALKAINEAPAPSAGMKPGQVRVVDKALKDVTMHQVIDHDPMDLAKGAIGLTPKKAVKVVFSANVGKANEQVNYLWYLNGKLQAKVATRSSGDAASMASKFISYDTPGAWQVQMTNAAGKVLAESAFNARRIQ